MTAEPLVPIGALARAAGVNVETIRFYQRRGLLGTPRKPASGIRRYGEDALGRVRFIKTAQRLGFSLDEVALLLRLDDGMHCSDAREVAEQKLRDVRQRLSELRRVETVLAELVRNCRTTRGRVSCPLIASLHRRREAALS